MQRLGENGAGVISADVVFTVHGGNSFRTLKGKRLRYRVMVIIIQFCVRAQNRTESSQQTDIRTPNGSTNKLIKALLTRSRRDKHTNLHRFSNALQ